MNKSLTEKICETGRVLYSKGLSPGKSGNISACSNDIIAITPSGVSLGYLNVEDIVFVDMEGKILTDSAKPSSELQLHLDVYQKRDDVRGIIHIHSPYATGFALAGERIERLEGFGKGESPFVKMVNYAPPGSAELAMLAADGLKNDDLVILENHGSVAIGKNLFEAALLAEHIEETAKTQFVARMLGKKGI